MALVGPTGSGKSTVILLCRLYEPQQGRILLDGVDIRDLPITTLRKRLGVVLQDTFLFSGSVADNLTLDTQRPRAELEQICADLGLGPLLERLTARARYTTARTRRQPQLWRTAIAGCGPCGPARSIGIGDG